MDIDMDIKELEAFVYVVENCSFSRAAELLHLTQPTISSHVSALERKLNIKLIVRTTKETYPSDAGKLLYKYAKEILQVRENAAIALRNFSQEMKGTISIAASTVPSQYYLPHLLQDFRARYPDITFNIQMEDSPKVIEMVATRAVEIGFSGTRVENHKCISQEFASDPMVLITPNTEKYQAFAGKPFPIEQLKEETFISREKGSGTYQAGKELLNELGIDIAQLRTAVEIRSTESVKQMVSEGLGVGLIAQSAQDGIQHAAKNRCGNQPAYSAGQQAQRQAGGHSAEQNSGIAGGEAQHAQNTGFIKRPQIAPQQLKKAGRANFASAGFGRLHSIGLHGGIFVFHCHIQK